MKLTNEDDDVYSVCIGMSVFVCVRALKHQVNRQLFWALSGHVWLATPECFAAQLALVCTYQQQLSRFTLLN